MSAARISSLTWEVARRKGVTHVAFKGALDEHADLTPLCVALIGRVVFRLDNVQRINSVGVHMWIDFLRSLPAVTELVFTHCSFPFVNQLNLTYGFCGTARVASFCAPYICEHCFHEQTKLITNDESVEAPHELVPSITCPECRRTMELDDSPERYLLFRRYTRPPALAIQ